MTKQLKIEDIAALVINRKNRLQHPRGRFDNAKRWEPAEEEKASCCDSIRTPSRNYPYSKMQHCRTMAHIARLYEVPLADLRKAVKARKPKTE